MAYLFTFDNVIFYFDIVLYKKVNDHYYLTVII